MKLLARLAALVVFCAAPAVHAQNYIWDGTTAYGTYSDAGVFPKSDLRPLGSAPHSKYFIAVDSNIVMQSIQDIRTAWLGARWLGYAAQSSDPAPSGLGGIGQSGYLWLSSSDSTLHLHYNGSDASVGQKPSLQQAYNNGSTPGPQRISISSARKGVVVAGDGSSSSFPVFAVEGTAAGDNWLSLTLNSGGGAETQIGDGNSRVGINTTPTSAINGLLVNRGLVLSTSQHNTAFRVQGDATPSGGIDSAHEQPTSWFAATSIKYTGGGTQALHRDVLIDPPTLDFASSGHITNSATLAVSGSPNAGGNITLDNTYSIWSQAGVVRSEGPLQLGTNSGTNTEYLQMGAGQSASVSASNTGRIRYNASLQQWEISANGGGYNPLTGGGGGGTVTGSGTTNTLPLWTDGAGGVLGDSWWSQASSTMSLASGKSLALATGATVTVGSQTLIGSTTDRLNAQVMAIASQVVGDMLYADTTTTFTRLAVSGTAGTFVRSTGTVPAWSTLVLPNSASAGDVFYASSSNTMGNLAVSSTAGTFIRSTGSAPAYSTLVLPNAATTGDLPYASASNTVSMLAAVASGSYLRAAGTSTAPVWSTLTLPNAATTGDILTATASNTVGVVAAVASGQVLASAGTSTVPAYTATPTVSAVNLSNSTSAFEDFNAGQSASVSASSHGRIIYDASNQHFYISENGGAYTQLGTSGGSGTVSSGTTNTVAKYTASTTVGNSNITDDGTTIVLGGTNLQTSTGGLDRSTSATLTLGGTNSTNLIHKASNTTMYTIIGTTAGAIAHDFAQPVNTSGSPTGIRYVAAAHTTLANADFNNVLIDTSATQQFGQSTALATVRSVYIKAPTYSSSVGTKNITTATTFAINAAPTQGTNTSITSLLAFAVEAGNAAFNGTIFADSSGGVDRSSAATLSLGTTNANAISIGHGTITTTITGNGINFVTSNTHGISVTNNSDATIIMDVKASSQGRIRTDSAGRFMTFADGDGTTDVMVVRGGAVGIGNGSTANPSSVMLDVVGSGTANPYLLVQTSSGPRVETWANSSKFIGQTAWKDGTPTKAVAWGMNIPVDGSIQNDLLFTTYDGSSWTESARFLNGSDAFKLSVGIRQSNATKSADYTLKTSDHTIFFDTSGATHNLTLPTPAAGLEYVVLDSTGSFNTHNLTLVRHASEKINGATSSATLTVNRGIYYITSDGTDWYVNVGATAL